MLTILLSQKTKINFPVLLGRRAFKKRLKRRERWVAIFNHIGLTFRDSYCLHGTNPKRPERVFSALSMHQYYTGSFLPGNVVQRAVEFSRQLSDEY